MFQKADTVCQSCIIDFHDFKVNFGRLIHGDLPEGMDQSHEQLYRKILQSPKEAMSDLEGLLATYPDNPILLHWLVMSYQCKDQFEKAVPYILTNYKKNPEYLDAICDYAWYQFLRSSDPEMIPKILDEKLSLKEFFPERELFHFTEVDEFYRLIAVYCIWSGHFERAEDLIVSLKSFMEHACWEESPLLQAITNDFVKQKFHSSTFLRFNKISKLYLERGSYETISKKAQSKEY